MNQRLSIQQGVFCCPGKVALSWIENLRAMGWSHQPSETRCFVLGDDIDIALDELLRMNVTKRSLTPGLDGYAASLWHRAPMLLRLMIEDEEE